MSLPLIFPPVQRDGQVLVDGGAMDNVPADVVKAMGAGRVVAINVGDLADLKEVNYSLLGLAGETLDAMMRANTKAGMKQADIIIDVPLADYGSLDWRKSDALIAEGYKAAESMRDSLLPLAVSEAEYARWKASRKSRRRTALPVPAFVRVEGFSVSDQRRLSGLLAGHVGVAFELAAIEADLTALSGLDRYETITWRIVSNANGENGLLVETRVKPYGPPFLMVGFNLENTTSQDFRLTLTARYLRYDIAGSGSELRIDGTIGSDPGIGAEIYRPLGSSPLFVAPYAGIGKRTFDVIDGDVILARYGQSVARVGADLGVNLGLPSDVRVGVSVAQLSTTIEVGDPGLPEVDGKETAADIKWRYDTQDSPVVPSRGINASATLRHIFDSPDVERPLTGDRTSTGLTQLAGEMNAFRSVRERDRLFVLAGGGTSFTSQPLPTDQFALGFPFHLGSFDNGEIRGDHYYIATAGYLRRLGRLPDFLGGPIFAGAWLESGDAFDDWSKATLRTNASAGVVMDTIIGPVMLAGSAGFDGRWRTYLGVGRLFARRQ